MLKTKKALVIGASGFLGGHIVRELVKQNYSVRILVRASSNINDIADLDFEKTIGDVLVIVNVVWKKEKNLKDVLGQKIER